MEYDSRLVARYILCLAKDMKDIDIDTTKIHKLLYILAGKYLAVYNRDILDEQPIAWRNGPIYPRVHKMLRRLHWLDAGQNESGFAKLTEIHTTLKSVVKSFGVHRSESLSDWTMEKGSPWWMTLQVSRRQEPTIKNEFMVNYFSQIFEKHTPNLEVL